MRTTTEFGKMKEQRPRVKKARKESTRERKPRNPQQITGFWGRGASLYRPGIFAKRYLEEHGQAYCGDIFRALKEDLERINKERVEIGDKPIRGGTYNSFAKYWHWFKLLGLIEPVDRREPAIYDFLEERVFYRLTDRGMSEVKAWEDPISVIHPEFR
jgi:hypothetical protein